MPIESWTKPEETPDLAARATAMIDAALVGTGLAPDCYWAAVRKGYNTPYNDPPRQRAERPAASAAADSAGDLAADPAVPPLPVSAMAAAIAAEMRAAS